MNNEITVAEIIKDYADEDKARGLFERIRWPKGPICPHCQCYVAYKITPGETSKTRKGVYKCKKCSKQFTVTVGTIFEDSHIPLNKWLMAIHLFCASKKGISSHQLHRLLGVTYKTAWFMAHRIRYAMSQPPLKNKLKGIVEVDETYVGGKMRGVQGRGRATINKTPVFSLIQRGGIVKSQPISNVKTKTLREILLQNVDPAAKLISDDYKSYWPINKDFPCHQMIFHSQKQYVAGDLHTNTVEGFFSLLKRGINGTFHHVDRRHLHRYCDEFDFRYNHRKLTDSERTSALVKLVGGKKLTYY